MGFGFNGYCMKAVIDLSGPIGNERLRSHYVKLPRYRLCIQSLDRRCTTGIHYCSKVCEFATAVNPCHISMFPPFKNVHMKPITSQVLFYAHTFLST